MVECHPGVALLVGAGYPRRGRGGGGGGRAADPALRRGGSPPTAREGPSCSWLPPFGTGVGFLLGFAIPLLRHAWKTRTVASGCGWYLRRGRGGGAVADPDRTVDLRSGLGTGRLVGSFSLLAPGSGSCWGSPPQRRDAAGNSDGFGNPEAPAGGHLGGRADTAKALRAGRGRGGQARTAGK